MKVAIIAFNVLALFVVSPTLSQTKGVLEPPELTGEPKKAKETSEADKQLFEIVGLLGDEVKAATALPKLDEFILRWPDSSDAFFLRAMCNACILNDKNF